MNGDLKYYFFWVESNLHCVIGVGGGIKIKFEEQGRDLV